MQSIFWKALWAMVLAAGMLASPVQAATSGSFVFDFVGDAGDNADGPQYDITLVGPTDDGGGCDEYVMIMVDPTGTVVDVDPGCVVGTTTSDDGDYGSVFAATASPITYALFDITGADATALGLLSQSDPAYFAYLVSHGRLLSEQTLAVADLPTMNPYVFTPQPPRQIPTLGHFGLGVLALLILALFGFQHRARRSRR